MIEPKPIVIDEGLISRGAALEDAIKAASVIVDDALNSTPPPFRPRTTHLAQTHGKHIRARALITCAEDAAGVKPSAVKAAAAIELLHLATLVHDDVIDNADTRRGLPTLAKKFGVRQAVICGDYLFCLALRLAAEAVRGEREPEEELPAVMERICMGELMQNLRHRDFSLSGLGYLRIIAGKTAALFEGSFYAGAMLCDSGRPHAKNYASIGRRLGMIFQLIDDCLDYESTIEQVRKPVVSDYEQGVVTLPLIFAMEREPRIRSRAIANDISGEDMRRAVLDAGGTLFARRVAARYRSLAMDELSELDAPISKKERIAELFDHAMPPIPAHSARSVGADPGNPEGITSSI